ncbi:unnamed protein product [Medioppia subpectinata]|uniref:Complexin n=1 Tax=Medioppia subpectinata TaxID=1979941 RepID=A0A7R9KBV3_9ACAR|nr:unnamed protein product [Medioppia subpectinata]CAG2100333.1 unnamed protein product [Medioppia subpectinata]
MDIGGGEGPTPEEKEKLQQLETERLDALREAEERRQEKHRKMEEEREGMRQGIRDKYGIKKREEKEAELKKEMEERMGTAAGGVNRSKKTPEEIAAEAAAADQDDFTKLKNSIETQVNDIKGQIEEKCSIQ